jgi:hypothetical protein
VSSAPARRAIMDRMACCVEDEEGFVRPRHTCKPMPTVLTIGDIPIVKRVPQGVAKRGGSCANRFSDLGGDSSPSEIAAPLSELRSEDEVRTGILDASCAPNFGTGISKENANSQRRGRENPKDQKKQEEAEKPTTNDGACTSKNLNTSCAGTSRGGRSPTVRALSATIPTGPGCAGTVAGKVVEDEFWEIIDEAIAANEKYMQNIPWPPPPPVDPFFMAGSEQRDVNMPHVHTAEGQWEFLKKLAREEGIQKHSGQTVEPAPNGELRSSTRSPSGPSGCVAFSNEPNHCAFPIPFRNGIDDAQGRSARAAMLMEEDSPLGAEVFNVEH